MLTTKLQIADHDLIDILHKKLSEHADKIIDNILNTSWYAYTIHEEENDNIVGGCLFRVFYGQLHIRYLVIDEECKGQKLGTMLIEKMVSWGKERGCTIAYVETLSFQALDFYLKLGFVLEHSRGGYSKGVALHFLRKDI